MPFLVLKDTFQLVFWERVENDAGPSTLSSCCEQRALVQLMASWKGNCNQFSHYSKFWLNVTLIYRELLKAPEYCQLSGMEADRKKIEEFVSTISFVWISKTLPRLPKICYFKFENFQDRLNFLANSKKYTALFC